MTDEKTNDKAKSAATPASPGLAKPAAPAAKAAPPPPPPPEHGEIGKYLESIGIKGEPLGNDAAGTERTEVQSKDWLSAAKSLKKEFGMTYLSNMTSLERKNGYQLSIQLENQNDKKYAVIKTTVPKDNPIIPSLTSVYACCNWNEREAYDMMGIKFDEHPDLKRILNPDDWTGYPLRKDYIGPLDELNRPLNYAKN